MWRCNHALVLHLVRRHTLYLYSVVMIPARWKEADARARGRFAGALCVALLFLFSSFSFASTYPYPSGYSPCSSSSDVATWSCADGPSGSFSDCVSSDVASNPGWVYDYSSCSGVTCSIFGTYNGGGPVDLGQATLSSCSAPPPSSSPSSSSPSSGSCSPAVGEPVDSSMSTSGSFCDPNTDCVSTGSQFTSGGVTFNTFVTNGSSCSPTASTVSPSSGIPCPSGYSPLSNGCECVSSSGTSYVSSLTAPTNSACNGGVSSNHLATVSPVSSSVSGSYSVPGTSVYCPSGSGYVVSSSGQVSCFVQAYNPSGSNSSFSMSPALLASNGSYYCPAGDSSIGSGSSMECISSSGSGSSGSGTASTGSATASTGSGSSFPSSLSTPGLPSFSGIQSISLSSSLPQVSSTSSGYTCPSSISFSVLGTSFSLSFKPLCTVAGDVRPVVVGAFSLSSLMLIAR